MIYYTNYARRDIRCLKVCFYIHVLQTHATFQPKVNVACKLVCVNQVVLPVPRKISVPSEYNFHTTLNIKTSANTPKDKWARSDVDCLQLTRSISLKMRVL